MWFDTIVQQAHKQREREIFVSKNNVCLYICVFVGKQRATPSLDLFDVNMKTN